MSADDQRVLWVSAAFAELLEVHGDDLVGRSIEDVLVGSSYTSIQQLFTGAEPHEALDDLHLGIAGPDGLVRDFAVRSVHYVDEGAKVVVELASVAVTHELELSDRDRDDLTGLAGRVTLLNHLDAVAGRASSVVVVFDIDHFNLVNSRFGVPAGDAILVEIARRLSATVRGDDLVVRLHGDRFAVCSTIQNRDEAVAVARRVERLVSEPVDVAGTFVSLSVSVGASWGPNRETIGRLFEQAERALRDAVTSGGRRLCFHDPDGEAGHWDDDGSFAADLRRGLTSGAFHVAYQPIVELGTGRVVKVEALARWNHPERGSIPPDRFIPLAERSGVIDELGAWILRRACLDTVAFHAEGIDVDLTVNLSAVQLRDPDIARSVADALADAGLAPARLWVEVTESVLVDDLAMAPLHELQDVGVRLVIDDFGTGYSTFQYVSRLPADALKIDTSFVAGLGIHPSDTAIVRSVINLARELGLQVVAEGIETESQRAQLLALNCRLGQGFLFDRALPFDAFIAANAPSLPASPSEPAPNVAANETMRLAALEACKVLDTDREAPFDSLVQLASQLLTTPMALISLIDADRQWFKARVGIEMSETARDVAICAHTIEQPKEPFVVADTSLDDRFADNPLVTASPNIRAYAGMPICSREGFALGTLCVLDSRPRVFTAEEVDLLSILAEQAGTLLDLRRRAAELHALIRRLRSTRSEDAVGATETRATSTSTSASPASAELLVELARTSARLDGPIEDVAHILRFGSLEIDLQARTVERDHNRIDLTPKEFELLAFMSARSGHVFSRVELMQYLWPSTRDSRAAAVVTSHIRSLRAKLEPNPLERQLIRTIRGQGYRFDPNDGTSTWSDGAPPELMTGCFTHIDGRIAAADAGMLSLLSAKRELDVVGHHVLEFIAPVSQPATQARLEMRAAGQVPGPQLITIQAADGHQIVTLVQSTVAEVDGRAAVASTFREVINPPRLLRQLVSGVLNQLPDAVIVTDPAHHVLSWNLAAWRLYGWTEVEVLGHTLDTVVRPVDDDDIVAARRALATSGRWSSETRQVTRDGTIVTVDALLTLIRDDDNEVTGIVAVNRPATRRPTPPSVAAG
ncbi:MAG TPA: EAL domain-containing protein [Ilumatobacteraceae bacterium]